MKYLVYADRISMFGGVHGCLEEYLQSDNAKTSGIDSVSIYKINDGKEYTVQILKLKSGTVKVHAYEH